MTNNYPVDVTILMPCLNEANTLPFCIDSAKKTLRTLEQYHLSGEILISDNGSTDNSREIAGELGCRVITSRSRGYGNALIAGIKSAYGRYIVMGDADGSYDFQESVPMVLKLQEGYELCMGSRFKGKVMPKAMPWKNRYIGNPILTGLLNFFYHSGFSDAHCGLRSFTRSAFDKMRLTCSGMEFASEMVVRAAELHLKRAEVPVTLYPDRRDRRPHLRPWRDGKRHLKFLLMYGPLWIFFIPSVLLILFSGFLFIGAWQSPVYHAFSFGNLRFGDHWIILAGGIFSMGTQGIMMGFLALIYRLENRHIPHSPVLRKIIKIAAFDNIILIGAVLFSLGFGIISYVVYEWFKVSFGPLYRIHSMIVGTSFMVTGIQLCFSGLLMLIMSRKIED